MWPYDAQFNEIKKNLFSFLSFTNMGRGRPPKQKECTFCHNIIKGAKNIANHECAAMLAMLARESNHADAATEAETATAITTNNADADAATEATATTTATINADAAIEADTGTATINADAATEADTGTATTTEATNNADSDSDDEMPPLEPRSTNVIPKRAIRYTKTRVANGNKALIANGFRYRLKSKPTGNKYRWLCSHPNCTGTAYTLEVSECSISYPQVRWEHKWRPHNHDSNESANRAHEMVVEYKVSSF